MRENYFILLGISFDPVETDERKISAIIEKKQQDWEYAKNNNPFGKEEAIQCLNRIPDIKEVMLNPAKRKTEAEKALQVKKDKIREIKEKLTDYMYGGAIDEKLIKKLTRKYDKYGIKKTDIEKLVNEAEDSPEEDIVIEVISEQDAVNIKNALTKIQMSENTLYEFLGMHSTDSPVSLTNKAKKMSRDILEKGEKDVGRDGAVQDLCGICCKLFANQKEKQKYDTYCEITRFPAFNETIDHVAGKEKTISTKAMLHLMEVGEKKCGIKLSEVREYIKGYIAYKGYDMAEESIICEACNTPNASQATICVQCGKPLRIICPVCGYKNGNMAGKCAKCNVNLAETEKVSGWLKECREALAKNDFQTAESTLRQVKNVWSTHPDISGLEQEIKEKKKDNLNDIAEIEKAVKDRYLYAARAKIHQAKEKGYHISPELEQEIHKKIAWIENQLSHLPSSEEEAFKSLVSLNDEVKDSVIVQEKLKQYPPQMPRTLCINPKGRQAEIIWEASNSVGTLEYVLIRKIDAAPNSESDGEEIYRGTSLSYTDENVAKEREIYYAVYVVRLGISSALKKNGNPLVRVDGLENLRVLGADRMVTMDWSVSKKVSSVDVWLYEGENCPKEQSAFQKIENKRTDGITLSGLKNGQKYWICLQANYNIQGTNYVSGIVTTDVIPEKPAQPLENFNVKKSEDIYTATWNKSEWDIILYYSQKKPSYQIGRTYMSNEIEDKYSKINLTLKHETEGEFSFPFVGICYIIPGVIHGKNVVLNEAVTISNVPEVSDLSVERGFSEEELYADFKWPKNINNVRMLYRRDSFPTGFEDEMAKRIEYNRIQYDRKGGIPFQDISEGTYYVTIYTYDEQEGERVYSDGVKAEYYYQSQKNVKYSIEYKKGFLSKKRSMTVVIESEGEFIFPKFQIVGKINNYPSNRQDGMVYCSCEEEKKIAGKSVYEFEVKEIKKDTKFRLFFTNDKYYSQFRLTVNGDNSVK